MKTLCVDTTADNMIITITDNDSIFSVINEEGKGTTSANIISSIDKALAIACLNLSDIDYIGAVIGPGSFTGIRIGISVINAFNLATNIPLIELTAFEALKLDEANILCLVTARKDAYYGCFYKDNNVVDQREYSIEDIKNYMDKVIIRSNYDYDFAISVKDNEYANRLAECMRRKAKENDTTAYLTPLYMKKSQAERNLDNNA